MVSVLKYEQSIMKIIDENESLKYNLNVQKAKTTAQRILIWSPTTILTLPSGA